MSSGIQAIDTELRNIGLLFILECCVVCIIFNTFLVNYSTGYLLKSNRQGQIMNKKKSNKILPQQNPYYK